MVGEKVYDLPPGARNTNSGYQQVQAQIPMETEGAPDHDVIWVANSDEGFGDYLMYRTYLPDPVVGTQGLQALAWDPSYTEYGAMIFPEWAAQARQAHGWSATTPLGLAAR